MKDLFFYLFFLLGVSIAAAGNTQSVNFKFTDTGNWITVNNSTFTVSNGHLNCVMANQGSSYRGDLRYNADASNVAGSANNNLTLIPTKDVYLAVKFLGDRPNGNVKMEMRQDNNGTLSWFNTQWSGGKADGFVVTQKNNYIYYFKLTKDAGYSSLSSVNIRQINIIIADAVAEPYSYSIDWVATFASLDELEEYENFQDDGVADIDECLAQSVNFNFADARNWITVNNSTFTVSNGNLNCIMANQGTSYRGDLRYNADASNVVGSADNNLTLIPTKDVYLAVKFIGDRPNGNIKMKMRRDNAGTLSWYNTQWNGGNADGNTTTSTGDKIYYFQLTKDAGYSSLSSVNIRQINIIIADSKAEPYSYYVDWIATFASLDDLENYKNTTDDAVEISSRTFVHPGISHKQSDLDRMKAMVNAQIEPYYSSYNDLKNNSLATYNYAVRGSDTCRIIVQDGVNFTSFRNDSKAAYLNAIMWAITGDTRYAQKCVEIFKAWANLTCFQGGGTESLNAGRVAWQIIEAAEIIKNTYSGWSAVDIQKFKDMLVYPGYSNIAKPTSVNNNNGTFYWRVYQGDSGRHGNQDLFGWRTVMALGIFLDNEIMFNRAYNYFTHQTHRADDIPYESGPPTGSSTPTSQTEWLISYPSTTHQTTVPDYGYNGVLDNYILETGQSQESARDQDHAGLGIGMVASLAEIAWNQGYDIYGMYDNRILKGYEWAMRYNVSYLQSYSNQPTAWEPTVASGEFIQFLDRTKRWYSLKVCPYDETGNTASISRGGFLTKKERPIYEMAIAHYGIRAGLPTDSFIWTQRALDINGLEKLGASAGVWHDHLGWGGLTFHRTALMAGDPVHFENGTKTYSLPQIPCTINAVDFDEYVGNGQNHTYYDLSKGNSGNTLRSNVDVDITTDDNNYVIYNTQNGEWVNYTIGISADGNFDFFVRHKTTSSGSKIKIVIDNNQTIQADLPVSSTFTETKIGSIQLLKGCKVMRVYFIGTDNATELSKIFIGLIA